MKDFAEKLLELRQDKKLSQVQLAEATGISKTAIAQWELKTSIPLATHVITLAKFFDVTTDYLLGVDKYR